MGSINPTLIGSGSALIAGGASLTILETAPKVTVLGDLASREGAASRYRLHHAGWVAVGYTGGGASLDLITWSAFIRYPYEDFRLGNFVFGDSYFWDLGAGTTIEFEIDW